MRMKLLTTSLAIGLLSLVTASLAQATVIVTYAEKPGLLQSSFINTTTYDFNSLSTGLHTDVVWSGTNAKGETVTTGTFNQLYIKSADQYGGADGSNYSVQGVNSPVTSTILNLNSPSSYFGLWWSAGDGANVLDFYSGANGSGNLIAEFTTANLLKVLSKSYNGNPNTGTYGGKDASEPFTFLNFFATPGNAWASVVFRNSSGSGFEADNISSRVAVYDRATDGAMPGVVFEAINGTTQTLVQVPEPGAIMAMLFVGFVSVGGPLLRRFKGKA